MDRLLQVEVFSKTAELGSLSKAADILRMSNAAESRHLSALEDVFGRRNSILLETLEQASVTIHDLAAIERLSSSDSVDS